MTQQRLLPVNNASFSMCTVSSNHPDNSVPQTISFSAHQQKKEPRQHFILIFSTSFLLWNIITIGHTVGELTSIAGFKFLSLFACARGTYITVTSHSYALMRVSYVLLEVVQVITFLVRSSIVAEKATKMFLHFLIHQDSQLHVICTAKHDPCLGNNQFCQKKKEIKSSDRSEVKLVHYVPSKFLNSHVLSII